MMRACLGIRRGAEYVVRIVFPMDALLRVPDAARLVALCLPLRSAAAWAQICRRAYDVLHVLHSGSSADQRLECYAQQWGWMRRHGVEYAAHLAVLRETPPESMSMVFITDYDMYYAACSRDDTLKQVCDMRMLRALEALLCDVRGAPRMCTVLDLRYLMNHIARTLWLEALMLLERLVPALRDAQPVTRTLRATHRLARVYFTEAFRVPRTLRGWDHAMASCASLMRPGTCVARWLLERVVEQRAPHDTSAGILDAHAHALAEPYPRECVDCRLQAYVCASLHQPDDTVWALRLLRRWRDTTRSRVHDGCVHGACVWLQVRVHRAACPGVGRPKLAWAYAALRSLLLAASAPHADADADAALDALQQIDREFPLCEHVLRAIDAHHDTTPSLWRDTLQRARILLRNK